MRLRFHHFLLSTVAALVLNTGAVAATSAQDAGTALHEVIKSMAPWYQQSQDEAPNEDHLPHVDPATQQKQTAHWLQVQTDLQKIDRNRLTLKERLDYDVLAYQAEVAANRDKFRSYEQPVNADTSFWSELNDSAGQPFSSLKEYRSYLSRLNDMPRYFDEQIDNMKSGLARGFTPPQIVLEGRDQGLKAVTEASDVQATPFWGPFKNMPDNIPAAEQKKLKTEAAAIIQDKVVPAYKKALDFFDNDYIPNARKELGADRMKDGKYYYQAQIYEFTTTRMSPEEIHKLGLKEVASLHKEMMQSMKASGFKGTFPEFLNFLRTDPQFYAKTPDDLLHYAAWIAKEYDGVAGRYFGFLPRSRFTIHPVPESEAPFYTSGRGGPGIYLVNTYKLPSRPLYALPALTLHESAPGHAQQMSLVEEDKELADFRKGYISAYGEGWALYCERLGDEMGLYHTEYDRFGMLSYQIWRAARLVVDTGIHTMGWTREEARKYLHDNSALPDHEIETEVDRYIAWPGQALSYYIGEADIWRLRHKAEKALGDKFNIRAFHDTVLSTGSVPLSSLDDAVDTFIKNGGKGPHPETE